MQPITSLLLRDESSGGVRRPSMQQELHLERDSFKGSHETQLTLLQ
jgi:hypothetical protein